jgi:DNA-binding NarL/FixJ family response regulator
VTTPKKAKVGVVAVDPLRSVGLLAILEDAAGVEAVPMQLSDSIDLDGIDALLLDSRAPIDEMCDLVTRLRRDRPKVKIVVMGALMEADHVQSVIGAGAKGYLPETASEGEIRMAMDVVLDGSIWAPRKVLARLIDAGGGAFSASSSDGTTVVGVMTPRELEVLHLLMDGRNNRDIASAMGIDEVTVKAHLGRMLRKTRSNNRVELTLRAIEERTHRNAPIRPAANRS